MKINDGDRPDNVAKELYGKSNFDWVVLLTANIVKCYVMNGHYQARNYNDFTVSKYGLNKN